LETLDTRLVEFLWRLGVLALPVPNGLGKDLTGWLLEAGPEGLVLSGGGDVGDEPRRDQAEDLLLCAAEKAGHPVLGICRGAQKIALTLGGEVKEISGHVGADQQFVSDIALAPGKCFHELGIRKLPPGLEALAKSRDGFVEMFAHQSRPWFGVMWHPERSEHFDENLIQFLKSTMGIPEK
jgi:gamma-glutamyl-gamma-aminobutyrate hydrolase PuuD